MSDRQHPAVDGSGVLGVLLDVFEPPEDAEVDQVDESSGGQHEVPEGDVLRVVAGGVGDGGVREGRLFLLLDCLVVGEHAGEDEEGNEEVEQVVDVHAAELVIGLPALGCWPAVADD